jgi:hypothetical protein
MAADAMRNAGPLKVPSYFNVEFRRQMATLFNVINPRKNAWGQMDVLVRAACVAYDYVDLLGYSIKSDSAIIYKPVKALLGDKCDAGSKTVGTGVDADISIVKDNIEGNSWIAGCYDMSGGIKAGRVVERWGRLVIY